MSNLPKILFSMPTKHHVEIARDEMEGLQELGYTCHYFPYAAKDGYNSRLGRIWIILCNAFNLIKIAYRFKPDVIYLNSRVEALAGVRDFITILLVKTLYRNPVNFILKSHGSDLSVFENRNVLLSRLVFPYLKKNITYWLFLSIEEINVISRNGYLPKGKIFTTKNIVNITAFKPDATFKSILNIPQHHKILLFSGRIIKEKGVFEVVEAFSRIREEYNTTLIIVGDGSEYDAIKQVITDKHLSDGVILTGFIPEKEVVKYYSNSDILVFPTYFPEGFPMALFNSVAAGMAVVTTPTRAAVDFLSSPENCLWVEPQNSNSVYNAIKKLLDDQQLTERMRENNVRIAAHFSKQQVAVELSGIINQLMSDSYVFNQFT
jgi:glycosyltransferase involved in cell wall biosynthesis